MMQNGRVDVLYGKKSSVYSYDVFMTEHNRTIFDGYGSLTLNEYGQCFSMRNESTDSTDITGYVSLEDTKIFGFKWGNKILMRPNFYISYDPDNPKSWEGSFNLSEGEYQDFYLADPKNPKNKIKVHCERAQDCGDVVMRINFDC